MNLTLRPGDALLITGASGCGKTSLLRALAGLWPFGSSGRIACPPQNGTLFLPQRSYMPQGSLRDAVCYPDIAPGHPDLENTMRQCRLAHLIPLLDRHDNWQQRISPGELQRIAFCRALLSHAQIILLDEATSALDEATEARLYQTLRQRFPQAVIVSIGHRSSLKPFHNIHCEIGGANGG